MSENRLEEIRARARQARNLKERAVLLRHTDRSQAAAERAMSASVVSAADVDWLLAEVDRLTARPSVTAEQVEAAAYALCGNDTDIADRGLSEDHWRERLDDARRVAAALGLDVEVARPPMLVRPNYWDPKGLREHLCQQQTFAPDNITRQWIQDLIDVLDVHRPIGPDGKHNDRHTTTCGCTSDEGGLDVEAGEGR